MGRLPLPVFLLVDELVSDEVEVSDVLEDAFSAVVEDGLVSLLVALFASFAIVKLPTLDLDLGVLLLPAILQEKRVF